MIQWRSKNGSCQWQVVSTPSHPLSLRCLSWRRQKAARLSTPGCFHKTWTSKIIRVVNRYQNTCCFCRRWWKGCLDQTGRSQSCIHLVLDEIKRWRDWSKEKRRNNCIVMYYNYIHQEKKRKRRNNWIQLHTSKLQLHTIAWPRNLQGVEVHKKS